MSIENKIKSLLEAVEKTPAQLSYPGATGEQDPAPVAPIQPTMIDSTDNATGVDTSQIQQAALPGSQVVDRTQAPVIGAEALEFNRPGVVSANVQQVQYPGQTAQDPAPIPAEFMELDPYNPAGDIVPNAEKESYPVGSGADGVTTPSDTAQDDPENKFSADIKPAAHPAPFVAESINQSKQFHVYHKVKGDRAGGPDYDHLKSFDSQEDADAYAAKYNDDLPKNKKSFHSAVVVGDLQHKKLGAMNKSAIVEGYTIHSPKNGVAGEFEGKIIVLDKTSANEVEKKLGLKKGALTAGKDGYSKTFVVKGDDGKLHTVYARDDKVRLRQYGHANSNSTKQLKQHLNEEVQSQDDILAQAVAAVQAGNDIEEVAKATGLDVQAIKDAIDAAKPTASPSAPITTAPVSEATSNTALLKSVGFTNRAGQYNTIGGKDDDSVDQLENQLKDNGFERSKYKGASEYQYQWTHNSLPNHKVVVNYRFGNKGLPTAWVEQPDKLSEAYDVSGTINDKNFGLKINPTKNLAPQVTDQNPHLSKDEVDAVWRHLDKNVGEKENFTTTHNDGKYRVTTKNVKRLNESLTEAKGHQHPEHFGKSPEHFDMLLDQSGMQNDQAPEAVRYYGPDVNGTHVYGAVYVGDEGDANKCYFTKFYAKHDKNGILRGDFQGMPQSEGSRVEMMKKLNMHPTTMNEAVTVRGTDTYQTVPIHRLKAGDEVHMHERGRMDKVKFNGWTDDDVKYGDGGPKYEHLKAIPGITKLGDIEAKSNGKEYGHRHHANFTALDEDGQPYDFNAYVFNGKLSVGPGADPVTFHKKTGSTGEPVNEAAAASDDTIAKHLDSLLNKGTDYKEAVHTVAKAHGSHPRYVVDAYERWGNFAHDDTFDESFAQDIDSLLTEADFSDEFKTKATSLFEAAVVARVNNEALRLEEAFNTKLAEHKQSLDEQYATATENFANTQAERLNSYINYLGEQWIKQNRVAVQTGVRAELTESFMSGLQKLFAEHYINAPQEKIDLVEEQQEQIVKLQESIEQLQQNIESLNEANQSLQRDTIISRLSEGLTDIEVAKLNTLCEGISFETEELFEAKVEMVKKNFFTRKSAPSPEQLLEETVHVTQPQEDLAQQKQVSPSMSAYVEALNRFKTK